MKNKARKFTCLEESKHNEVTDSRNISDLKSTNNYYEFIRS